MNLHGVSGGKAAFVLNEKTELDKKWLVQMNESWSFSYRQHAVILCVSKV